MTVAVEPQGAATAQTRRALLACGLAAATGVRASSRTTLTVAAFPLVDEIARAAIPIWQRLHPDVALHIVSRQYADHHTAMTTALSTSVLLPDVMALESSFVGRFAQGGGLEDLSRAPYLIAQSRERMVPYAYDQAIGCTGAVVAMPTDIGPGALLYRSDILARSGVSEHDLTQSWDSYVAAGRRIKANTGAYLIAHVQEIKDILLRTGLQSGAGLHFDRDSRVLVQSGALRRAGSRLCRCTSKPPLQTRWWVLNLTTSWIVASLSDWPWPTRTTCLNVVPRDEIQRTLGTRHETKQAL